MWGIILKPNRTRTKKRLSYFSASSQLRSAIAYVLLTAAALVLLNFYASNTIRNIVIADRQRSMEEKAQMITGGSYGIQIQTKYDDEIGELAETINEMSMRVNQNEKTQTEFISSLSHELRTPLTAITGWSETLLHSDDLDEANRRGMKIIHREAGRLTEMVISLLDFTRIQDGRMTLNIEPTDLRSEFEDTVFMYGSRLESDGIHLEYIENEDDIPEISCDPQRMRQVFLNILDNASKHGGEGKRIDAEICNFEDAVEVRAEEQPGHHGHGRGAVDGLYADGHLPGGGYILLAGHRQLYLRRGHHAGLSSHHRRHAVRRLLLHHTEPAGGHHHRVRS